MPNIKNVGKKVRMVADRILQPGESKSITAKQAEAFASDADFEITELTPTPDPLRPIGHLPQKGEERPVLGEEKTVVRKKRGKKK